MQAFAAARVSKFWLILSRQLAPPRFSAPSGEVLAGRAGKHVRQIDQVSRSQVWTRVKADTAFATQEEDFARL